ncbi:MAG: CDP-diacylglycerol--glycerol-3-phosphate 3-phosphatidyltransferase [Candidatus Anammoxibacter sp.]
MTFTLPNKITIVRLLLAIVFFVTLSFRLFDISFYIFIVAVISDFFDGYLARRNKEVTDFGRIADPFVDKIIICGGFIMFVLFAQDILAPWMVILIVSREFMINSLRGFAESKGVIFPSDVWGKVKMFLQSATVCGLLLYFAFLHDVAAFKIAVIVFIWITIVITVVSAVLYLIKAKKVLIASLSIDNS